MIDPIFSTEFDIQLFTDEAKMVRHCAPIFFLPNPDAKPSEITNNGTISLINTGSHSVLVTCNHVIDEFRKYKEQEANACLCTVFDSHIRQPIQLEETLIIDTDPGLDLAVLRAKADWHIGTKEFFRIQRFPIPKPKQGHAIALLGFPGKARVTTDEIGNFQYSAFGLIVSSVSDRKFVVLGKGPGRGHLRDNQGKVIPAIDVGGMSGSPAYRRDSRAGFELAGFVQMGNTSSDDLFFTSASALQPDGTLKK